MLWIALFLMVVAVVAQVMIVISRRVTAECFRPYSRDAMPSHLELNKEQRFWIRMGLLGWRIRLPTAFAGAALLTIYYL